MIRPINNHHGKVAFSAGNKRDGFGKIFPKRQGKVALRASGLMFARVPAPTLRFAIVDDHQAVADAVVEALESSRKKMTFVGRFASIKEAEIKLPQVKPALVIVDYRLGDGVASTLVQNLRPVLPNVKWLLFTGWPKAGVLRTCMASGIHGCVSKAGSYTDLIHAIDAIMAGDTFYCPESIKSVIKMMSGEKDVKFPETDRAIISLVAEGLNPKEIADRLDLSTKTVHNALARIRQSLGARSMVEVAKYAIEQGLAPPH